MSNELHHFNFQESQQLRVEIDEAGDPWFCAKDVCDILGYKNHNDIIKKHCHAKGVSNRYPLKTAGGTQYPAFINEGNLYRLIIKSNKPEATPFESWVCDEVLPSIRKHGRYVKPDAEIPPAPPSYDTAKPFQRLHPTTLSELRRMSKSLAQAYLMECGVTPEYVAELLGNMPSRPAQALCQGAANAAPLHVLRSEIPLHAYRNDAGYWYVTRERMLDICGDYGIAETMRMLRDLGYLRHNHNSLTIRTREPDGKRLLVFCVSKEFAKDRPGFG